MIATLTIPKKCFNNLYYLIKETFQDYSIRFLWIYGGSSSSKTYSVVQRLIIEMMSNENDNSLILRKYATDIKDSIFSDFVGIIKNWNLIDLFTIQQNYIFCNDTGSYCRFRGLDDSEKVKGISNFKRVVLEEVTQFDEIDFKQIKKRLRGKEGQQIIGMFNPVSEDHWIKENVFDKENLIELKSIISGKWQSQDTVVLKTNYLDNKFIVGEFNERGNQIGGFVDIHTIADFEKDKINDFNYYQIYGLGNWGKLRVGGEFWKDFNTNIHTKELSYNAILPIHMTWDENVNPYLTCLIWQIDGLRIYQIDEICLPDPNNRITAVCEVFLNKYKEINGLFIYGDRTSIKEDTKLEKGENFFTLICQKLNLHRPRLRMQSVNPSVVQSGGFINKIYNENYLGLSIEISKNCKKSIFDYQYALEDSDGTIKKSKKSNPLTKVSYEEFGHCSDAKRYFITTAFASQYNEYLSGGKKSKVTVGKSYSKSGY